MRVIRNFYVLLFFLGAFKASAQTFPQKNYPQSYFQWPVGAAVGIAANFGELRPNHYHMGLDCRTDQKENVPVYAAAAGYIAKVKIEPFGFGRCIYINHPNGFTTLYAHLNAFEPALEKYVTAQQYLLKKWNVFIDIPKEIFPVKKGEYIAASGNTGGSQGPHTHFEIRDTKTDKNVNPLLFGFPLKDDIAPYVLRIAVYDRTKSTYDQSPKIYAVKKVNGVYTVAGGKIPAPSDKISFAITAYDRYTGSSNQNGIYGAAVFDNEKRISSFEMDNISYDDTRYLNAHIDYRFRSSGGSWLQHLSPLPGYFNSIYTTDNSRGIISMNKEAHAVKIIVADANRNETEVRFTLEPSSALTITAPRENIQKFIPGIVNISDNPNCFFYLPENALYDTVNFVYRELKGAGETIHQIQNGTIPLHTYFTVHLKGSFSDTGKIVMKRSYGSKEDYRKASFHNGWYGAEFREFGNFQLLEDLIPPSLIPVGFHNGMKAAGLSRILFSVKDNTEEIRSFTALLDGEWLLFSNDKGRNFIYYFDAHCAPGPHTLKVAVVDQVGNITEKTYTFTR